MPADVATLDATEGHLSTLLSTDRAVSSLQALIEDVATVAAFNPFFADMATKIQTYKAALDALQNPG